MSTKKWIKTRITNLIRNTKSEIFYVKVKVSGKQVWASLGTDSFTRAQILLPDKLKEIRGKVTAGVENQQPGVERSTDMGYWIDRAITKAELRIKKESTLRRYKVAARALSFSWPKIRERDIRRITEDDCLRWGKEAPGAGTGLGCGFGPGRKLARSTKARKSMSPSAFNQALAVLKDAFALAIREGIVTNNWAAQVPRMTPTHKALNLPTREQFEALATEIGDYAKHGAWAKDCEFLVRLLASSGLRRGEVKYLTWDRVDFTKGTLFIQGEKTRTSTRTIPLFPALRSLLLSVPEEKRHGPVCRVTECQISLTTACKNLGIARLVHHDLRHLFATTAIESGVDIPTVSRWLGHADGGVLAMRTYGHLRSEHSHKMAELVKL